ncbi:MAG: putative PurR-regulated permease PerM [Francisella sp.]|jgi:predicted PurR-regulated permease PerM
MNFSSIKKIVIVCLLGALILWILYPFIYAILFAALLAAILSPLQQKLEKYIGKHKSSFLISIGVLLCIFIPLFLVISYAINEIIQYTSHTKSLAETSHQLSGYPLNMPYLGEFLQERLDDFIKILQQDKQKILADIGNLLPTVKYLGTASVSLIINFFIALLLTYQFLVSRENLERFFGEVLLKDFNDGDNFIKTAVTTTRKVSLALASTAIVVGIVMGIVYVSVGLLSPVLFAFITALASMIPFLVTVVYILLAFGVLVTYGATKAIIILAIGLALHVFTDNIMQPKIINKEAELSFVASLLGILGGLHAFGVLGVFLGPVIFNVAYIGIEKIMQETRKTFRHY